MEDRIRIKNIEVLSADWSTSKEDNLRLSIQRRSLEDAKPRDV